MRIRGKKINWRKMKKIESTEEKRGEEKKRIEKVEEKTKQEY